MRKQRFHVHLSERQIEALKAMSDETGAPMAELIRRAVDKYLERQEAVKETAE